MHTTRQGLPVGSAVDGTAGASMPFITAGEDGLASWEIAYAQELALSNAGRASSGGGSRKALWLLALLVCVGVAVQGALTGVETTMPVAAGAAQVGSAVAVADVEGGAEK